MRRRGSRVFGEISQIEDNTVDSFVSYIISDLDPDDEANLLLTKNNLEVLIKKSKNGSEGDKLTPLHLFRIFRSFRLSHFKKMESLSEILVKYCINHVFNLSDHTSLSFKCLVDHLSLIKDLENRNIDILKQWSLDFLNRYSQIKVTDERHTDIALSILELFLKEDEPAIRITDENKDLLLLIYTKTFHYPELNCISTKIIKIFYRSVLIKEIQLDILKNSVLYSENVSNNFSFLKLHILLMHFKSLEFRIEYFKVFLHHLFIFSINPLCKNKYVNKTIYRYLELCSKIDLSKSIEVSESVMLFFQKIWLVISSGYFNSSLSYVVTLRKCSPSGSPVTITMRNFFKKLLDYNDSPHFLTNSILNLASSIQIINHKKYNTYCIDFLELFFYLFKLVIPGKLDLWVVHCLYTTFFQLVFSVSNCNEAPEDHVTYVEKNFKEIVTDMFGENHMSNMLLKYYGIMKMIIETESKSPNFVRIVKHFLDIVQGKLSIFYDQLNDNFDSIPDTSVEFFRYVNEQIFFDEGKVKSDEFYKQTSSRLYNIFHLIVSSNREKWIEDGLIPLFKRYYELSVANTKVSVSHTASVDQKLSHIDPPPVSHSNSSQALSQTSYNIPQNINNTTQNGNSMLNIQVTVSNNQHVFSGQSVYTHQQNMGSIYNSQSHSQQFVFGSQTNQSLYSQQSSAPHVYGSQQMGNSQTVVGHQQTYGTMYHQTQIYSQSVLSKQHNIFTPNQVMNHQMANNVQLYPPYQNSTSQQAHNQKHQDAHSRQTSSQNQSPTQKSQVNNITHHTNQNTKSNSDVLQRIQPLITLITDHKCLFPSCLRSLRPSTALSLLSVFILYIIRPYKDKDESYEQWFDLMLVSLENKFFFENDVYLHCLISIFGQNFQTEFEKLRNSTKSRFIIAFKSNIFKIKPFSPYIFEHAFKILEDYPDKQEEVLTCIVGNRKLLLYDIFIQYKRDRILEKMQAEERSRSLTFLFSCFLSCIMSKSFVETVSNSKLDEISNFLISNNRDVFKHMHKQDANRNVLYTLVYYEFKATEDESILLSISDKFEFCQTLCLVSHLKICMPTLIMLFSLLLPSIYNQITNTNFLFFLRSVLNCSEKGVDTVKKLLLTYFVQIHVPDKLIVQSVLIFNAETESSRPFAKCFLYFLREKFKKPETARIAMNQYFIPNFIKIINTHDSVKILKYKFITTIRFEFTKKNLRDALIDVISRLLDSFIGDTPLIKDKTLQKIKIYDNITDKDYQRFLVSRLMMKILAWALTTVYDSQQAKEIWDITLSILTNFNKTQKSTYFTAYYKDKILKFCKNMNGMVELPGIDEDLDKRDISLETLYLYSSIIQFSSDNAKKKMYSLLVPFLEHTSDNQRRDLNRVRVAMMQMFAIVRSFQSMNMELSTFFSNLHHVPDLIHRFHWTLDIQIRLSEFLFSNISEPTVVSVFLSLYPFLTSTKGAEFRKTLIHVLHINNYFKNFSKLPINFIIFELVLDLCLRILRSECNIEDWKIHISVIYAIVESLNVYHNVCFNPHIMFKTAQILFPSFLAKRLSEDPLFKTIFSELMNFVVNNPFFFCHSYLTCHYADFVYNTCDPIASIMVLECVETNDIHAQIFRAMLRFYSYKRLNICANLSSNFSSMNSDSIFEAILRYYHALLYSIDNLQMDDFKDNGISSIFPEISAIYIYRNIPHGNINNFQKTIKIAGFLNKLDSNIEGYRNTMIEMFANTSLNILYTSSRYIRSLLLSTGYTRVFNLSDERFSELLINYCSSQLVHVFNPRAKRNRNLIILSEIPESLKFLSNLSSNPYFEAIFECMASFFLIIARELLFSPKGDSNNAEKFLCILDPYIEVMNSIYAKFASSKCSSSVIGMMKNIFFNTPPNLSNEVNLKWEAKKLKIFPIFAKFLFRNDCNNDLIDEIKFYKDSQHRDNPDLVSFLSTLVKYSSINVKEGVLDMFLNTLGKSVVIHDINFVFTKISNWLSEIPNNKEKRSLYYNTAINLLHIFKPVDEKSFLMQIKNIKFPPHREVLSIILDLLRTDFRHLKYNDSLRVYSYGRKYNDPLLECWSNRWSDQSPETHLYVFLSFLVNEETWNYLIRLTSNKTNQFLLNLLTSSPELCMKLHNFIVYYKASFPNTTLSFIFNSTGHLYNSYPRSSKAIHRNILFFECLSLSEQALGVISSEFPNLGNSCKLQTLSNYETAIGDFLAQSDKNYNCYSVALYQLLLGHINTSFPTLTFSNPRDPLSRVHKPFFLVNGYDTIFQTSFFSSTHLFTLKFFIYSHMYFLYRKKTENCELTRDIWKCVNSSNLDYLCFTSFLLNLILNNTADKTAQTSLLFDYSKLLSDSNSIRKALKLSNDEVIEYKISNLPRVYHARKKKGNYDVYTLLHLFDFATISNFIKNDSLKDLYHIKAQVIFRKVLCGFNSVIDDSLVGIIQNSRISDVHTIISLILRELRTSHNQALEPVCNSIMNSIFPTGNLSGFVPLAYALLKWIPQILTLLIPYRLVSSLFKINSFHMFANITRMDFFENSKGNTSDMVVQNLDDFSKSNFEKFKYVFFRIIDEKTNEFYEDATKIHLELYKSLSLAKNKKEIDDLRHHIDLAKQKPPVLRFKESSVVFDKVHLYLPKHDIEQYFNTIVFDKSDDGEGRFSIINKNGEKVNYNIILYNSFSYNPVEECFVYILNAFLRSYTRGKLPILFYPTFYKISKNLLFVSSDTLKSVSDIMGRNKFLDKIIEAAKSVDSNENVSPLFFKTKRQRNTDYNELLSFFTKGAFGVASNIWLMKSTFSSQIGSLMLLRTLTGLSKHRNLKEPLHGLTMFENRLQTSMSFLSCSYPLPLTKLIRNVLPDYIMKGGFTNSFLLIPKIITECSIEFEIINTTLVGHERGRNITKNSKLIGTLLTEDSDKYEKPFPFLLVDHLISTAGNLFNSQSQGFSWF